MRQPRHGWTPASRAHQGALGETAVDGQKGIAIVVAEQGIPYEGPLDFVVDHVFGDQSLQIHTEDSRERLQLIRRRCATTPFPMRHSRLVHTNLISELLLREAKSSAPVQDRRA